MFTSGFFNSVNGDRKYNAEQMSAIFDGLITDGIFDTVGDHFQVTPGDGLSVSVGTGRAWLNQTWSYNDSLYPIELTAASPTLGRKDLICLKVDKSTSNRTNSIALIEGTPASTPTEPTVSDDSTNGIYYHKLAAVTVPAGATSISAANIQNYIGLSTGTPYVTGIIETTAVDELWSQWDGEFNDWWENTIKPIINTETVTRLQNNIDHITPKEATMNLYGFSHINPPPSGKTYQEYSTDAILNQINSLLNNINTAVAGKQPIGNYITAASLSGKYGVYRAIGSRIGTGSTSFTVNFGKTLVGYPYIFLYILSNNQSAIQSNTDGWQRDAMAYFAIDSNKDRYYYFYHSESYTRIKGNLSSVTISGANTNSTPDTSGQSYTWGIIGFVSMS